MPLDADVYRHAVRREADALVAAGVGAGLDAPVPSCPDWDVAALLGHIGRVHRWAAGCITTNPLVPPPNIDPPPDGDASAGYARDGAATLVAALERSADDAGLDVRAAADGRVLAATPGPRDGDAPGRRRARRRRRDADRRAARRRRHRRVAHHPPGPAGQAPPTGSGETLHLHCTDRPGEWLLRLTPERLEVERAHAKGDVAVRGAASDLLLVLLHRAPTDTVEVLGDRPTLDAFLAQTTF